MKTYIIELHDTGTFQKEYITFSEKEIFSISFRYRQTNSLGFIVEEIHNKSRNKEFDITTGKQKLYQVADEIIKDKYGCNTLHGAFRIDGTPQTHQIHPEESNDLPNFKPENVHLKAPELSEPERSKPEKVHLEAVEISKPKRLKSEDVHLKETELSKPKPLKSENVHLKATEKYESFLARHQPKEKDKIVHLNNETYKEQYLPFILVHYNNSYDTLEKVKNRIIKLGKTPVIWTRSQGLVFEKNAGKHHFSNKIDMSDPHKVLDFIIRKPQKKVDYIFEDFHHYIEKKDQISPTVGKLRSLIKLLHRNLSHREESVYFLVPSFYELPDELSPIFSNLGTDSHFKYLNKFAQLMTHHDYISKIKPIIGMDILIERIIQILGQKETNNPLLVGKPGVGKTAIVEGFARILATGKLPSKLYGKKLYALSINSLIAGTKYRGDFEIRLEGLMNEVLQKKDEIIIFIDEIHTLLYAGLTEGSSGAGDILKPVLSRGEFPCIGATTPEGKELFAKDPAFSRRFKPVIVNEPSVEKAYEIVKGVSAIFENHHELRLSNDALVASIELSMKHLPHENLPAKAISLLDASASYASMKGKSVVKKQDVYQEIQRLKDLSF